MAGNAIALIQKYATKAWDEVYVAEARCSILDGEKDFLKFTGTKTVKVAKFMGSGLKDYGRANVPVSGDFGGDGHSGLSFDFGKPFKSGRAGAFKVAGAGARFPHASAEHPDSKCGKAAGAFQNLGLRFCAAGSGYDRASALQGIE